MSEHIAEPLVEVDVEGEHDLILRNLRQERGTRWYWDGTVRTIQGVQVAMRTKAHHWGVNRRTGNLVLLQGPDPLELLADRD